MSKRFRVVITDFIQGDLAPERQLLGGIADLVALDASGEKDLIGNVDNADALMMYHNVIISPETIKRLTNCKLIVRCGVGYDNVDYKFARTRGIPVANVPDYGTEEVADSAIGLMLALTRGINFHNNFLRPADADWRFHHVAPLYRLRGRTFAILGLGRIGTATATRAKALGMDVIFYDPYKPDGYDKALGIRRIESFDEFLALAHVLSCHCPLTPETHHIINAASIEKMPRGSYLINTSRGNVVDVVAIPDAIASGRLAGAGIDVLPQEPPPADHPLIVAWRDPKHPAYNRVIINAHNAFYSVEGLRDMRVKGAEACRRALVGLPLRNVVN